MNELKHFIYESVHRPRRFFLNLIESPAVILLYHRVTTLEKDSQQLAVTPENFYEHVSILRKKHSLLSINEFADLIRSQKKIPRNSVILTFDDGYADNYLEALPLLQQLNAQALFYITTSLLGTDKELWWDDLERIFFDQQILPRKADIVIGNDNLSFATGDSVQRYKAYQKLHHIIKYASPKVRSAIFDQLYSWSSVSASGRKTHRMMNNDEVVLLSKSPSAVIGAHTHTHTALSALSADEQKKDIEKSVDILQQLTGNRIEHFSYPFGLKKDYTNQTLQIVRDLNFQLVCANYYGQVHSWTSRFELPRCLVRNWNGTIFQQQMNRFFRY